MRQVPFEVLIHAENALAYSKQALAIPEVWAGSLDGGDEHEFNCVAAIHGLVHELREYLRKVTGV